MGKVNNKDIIVTGTKDLSHEFLRPIPDIVRLTYLIGSFIADSRKRECDISIKNEDIFENLIAAMSMIWYMARYLDSPNNLKNSTLLIASNSKNKMLKVTKLSSSKLFVFPRLVPVERKQIPKMFDTNPITTMIGMT